MELLCENRKNKKLSAYYFGLSEEEIPHTINLHGEDGNVAENIAELEPAFESVLCRPRWNMFVGQKFERRIGFVDVIWAPMAALIVQYFPK